MCDGFHHLLEAHPLPKGRVVDAKDFRLHLNQLREAAEIAEWPHNGLRHSFGSYHLALYGDAIKTSSQMGHRDSNIIHNHYKALVLKAEAEKYWRLGLEFK
jgi:integrase